MTQENIAGGGEEQKESLQWALGEIEELRRQLGEFIRADKKRSPGGGSPDLSKALAEVSEKIISGMQSLLESQRRADKENFERMIQFSQMGKAAAGGVGEDVSAMDEILDRLEAIEEKSASQEAVLFDKIAQMLQTWLANQGQKTVAARPVVGLHG